MYRAATLRAMRRGVDLADARAAAACACEAEIGLEEADGKLRVLLDGEDVSAEIRAPELTRKVRLLAASPPVRGELVRKQRALAGRGPVVMEGRDIGTVVLPDAAAKFFLEAAPSERARRRARDLESAGERADLETLAREMDSRDRSDRERGVAPLAAADDAEVVDTTALSAEEVTDLLQRRTRAILAEIDAQPL
jgi:cytidylate kinase